MISALKYDDALICPLTLDRVDEPVFLGQAARPASLQGPLQRLGFADPDEGRGSNVLNELIEPLVNLVVVAIPKEVVLPTKVGEVDPHSVSDESAAAARERSRAPPACAWATEAASRFALAGLLNR